MNATVFNDKLRRVARQRGFTPEEYALRIQRISSGHRVCAHRERRAVSRKASSSK